MPHSAKVKKILYREVQSHLKFSKLSKSKSWKVLESVLTGVKYI